MILPDNNLLSGPFGLCYGYWDETSQVFIKDNQTEQWKCCLRSCEPTKDKCVEICEESTSDHNKETCYKTCFDIKKECEDNCRLLSNLWGEDNPIFKGTTAYDCGDGFAHPIDKECLRKNKDGILKLCGVNCIPTSDIDCYDHCNHSYYILNEGSNLLDISKPVTNLNIKTIRNLKKINILHLYIFVIVVIVVLVFGLYIFFV
jgi:hypothetical protein